MLDFPLKSLDITEQIPSFPRKFAIVAQKNDFENQGKLTLIDEYRKNYRKQYGL